MLTASLAVCDSGPLLILGGEADLTCAAQLSAALSALLGEGPRSATVDISRLCFADGASIRSLVLAARTLTARGGRLRLLCPQPQVTRVLDLLGADQVMEIRGIETTWP